MLILFGIVRKNHYICNTKTNKDKINETNTQNN